MGQNLFNFFFGLTGKGILLGYVHLFPRQLIQSCLQWLFHLTLNFMGYIRYSYAKFNDDINIYSNFLITNINFNPFCRTFYRQNLAKPPTIPPLIPATPFTSVVANPAIIATTSSEIFTVPSLVRIVFSLLFFHTYFLPFNFLLFLL